MKVGIMQPYFWPYLGYFQLLNMTDKFILYDNIEYTKKGWINRNRYLCQGTDKYFTIPIEKDSDFLDVKDRKISRVFDPEKLINQIKMAYIKAPFFADIYPLFCKTVEYDEPNLFEYIFHSIRCITEYLGIETEIIVSSKLGIGHEKKGKDKVMALCKSVQGTEYINPIGGIELYDKIEFLNNGIKLQFIQMKNTIKYKQFTKDFIPALSILDVLMFNSLPEVKKMLLQYQLL